ncbi:MAG TPA: hypothetical protein VFV67_34655 [Actinophytocola sp.]|uniref:hypothetical protein n=1 Tax=Actinophytocola sp. TaxID=1872138 RepID=UPI002DBB9F5A|nr:hypothetical protein [Actinophytocola sp.]HEU5475807.1 hypothetical protein [Actinophytocola sp.]
MSDGFTADAGTLARQATEFPDLAARAGTVHRELTETLAGLGACWGADRVGQSFAATHTGPADATLGGLGALPDRLGSVGTRFADSAAAYQRQDAAGAVQIEAADG